MAGLDPAIHVFVSRIGSKTWITGTGPVMTTSLKTLPGLLRGAGLWARIRAAHWFAMSALSKISKHHRRVRKFVRTPAVFREMRGKLTRDRLNAPDHAA